MSTTSVRVQLTTKPTTCSPGPHPFLMHLSPQELWGWPAGTARRVKVVPWRATYPHVLGEKTQLQCCVCPRLSKTAPGVSSGAATGLGRPERLMTSALSRVPAISAPSPTSLPIPGRALREGGLRGGDTPTSDGKKQPPVPELFRQKSRVPDSRRHRSLNCHNREQPQKSRLMCTA